MVLEVGDGQSVDRHPTGTEARSISLAFTNQFGQDRKSSVRTSSPPVRHLCTSLMNALTRHSAFQTTRWSLIDAAQSPHPSDRSRALEELASRYQPPVYAFLRRRGMNPDNAADTAQAFFATVVLHRDLFARAQQGAGRLRTLVLTALENFVVDAVRKDAARARAECGHVQGTQAAFRAEEDRLDIAGPNEGDCFDKRWAVQVLEESIGRCEEHFTSTGKERHWRLFHLRVLGPTMTAATPPPLQTLCTDLGFATPADAAAAVQSVKRRLAAIIEQVVGEECDQSQVRDELNHFSRVLGASLPAL